MDFGTVSYPHGWYVFFSTNVSVVHLSRSVKRLRLHLNCDYVLYEVIFYRDEELSSSSVRPITVYFIYPV